MLKFVRFIQFNQILIVLTATVLLFETKLVENKSSNLKHSVQTNRFYRSGPSESEITDILSVNATVNSTALLPCRPERKSTNENSHDEYLKGSLLWKRGTTNEYLIHNNRRLHPDTRYILDMSSVDQTIADLRIDNVQKSDEGQYVCLYSNGQTVFKRRVNLSVLVPPIICENSSSPSKVIAKEGDSTVLQCKAWGVPEPQMIWYFSPKDGRPYRLYDDRDKRFLIKPNQLTIPNVTRDMRGTFKCLAQNGLEKDAWRLIDLEVHYPPVIEMSNLKLGQVLRGTTMVRAEITGYPIKFLYWEFKGRLILGPNSNCLVPMPNEKYCVVVDKAASEYGKIKTTLYITNLTNANYGNYTCVVDSPYGPRRNSTEVFRTYPVHTLPWDIMPTDTSYRNNFGPHYRSYDAMNTKQSLDKQTEKHNKRATYLIRPSGSQNQQPTYSIRSMSSRRKCLNQLCTENQAISFVKDKSLIHDKVLRTVQLIMTLICYL